MSSDVRTTDELNRSNRLRLRPTMSGENARGDDETEIGTEQHLRRALQHLSEARDGDDLRKTNAVAISEVENTVSTVLREYQEDE